jgi:hypothetical protein
MEEPDIEKFVLNNANNDFSLINDKEKGKNDIKTQLQSIQNKIKKDYVKIVLFERQKGCKSVEETKHAKFLHPDKIQVAYFQPENIKINNIEIISKDWHPYASFLSEICRKAYTPTKKKEEPMSYHSSSSNSSSFRPYSYANDYYERQRQQQQQRQQEEQKRQQQRRQEEANRKKRKEKEEEKEKRDHEEWRKKYREEKEKEEKEKKAKEEQAKRQKKQKELELKLELEKERKEQASLLKGELYQQNQRKEAQTKLEQEKLRVLKQDEMNFVTTEKSNPFSLNAILESFNGDLYFLCIDEKVISIEELKSASRAKKYQESKPDFQLLNFKKYNARDSLNKNVCLGIIDDDDDDPKEIKEKENTLVYCWRWLYDLNVDLNIFYSEILIELTRSFHTPYNLSNSLSRPVYSSSSSETETKGKKYDKSDASWIVPFLKIEKIDQRQDLVNSLFQNHPDTRIKIANKKVEKVFIYYPEFNAYADTDVIFASYDLQNANSQDVFAKNRSDSYNEDLNTIQKYIFNLWIRITNDENKSYEAPLVRWMFANKDAWFYNSNNSTFFILNDLFTFCNLPFAYSDELKWAIFRAVYACCQIDCPYAFLTYFKYPTIRMDLTTNSILKAELDKQNIQNSSRAPLFYVLNPIPILTSFENWTLDMFSILYIDKTGKWIAISFANALKTEIFKIITTNLLLLQQSYSKIENDSLALLLKTLYFHMSSTVQSLKIWQDIEKFKSQSFAQFEFKYPKEQSKAVFKTLSTVLINGKPIEINPVYPIHIALDANSGDYFILAKVFDDNDKNIVFGYLKLDDFLKQLSGIKNKSGITCRVSEIVLDMKTKQKKLSNFPILWNQFQNSRYTKIISSLDF